MILIMIMMNGIKYKILAERKLLPIKIVCYICSPCYQKMLLITVSTKMHGACLCLGRVIPSFIYTISMFNSEDVIEKNPTGVVPVSVITGVVSGAKFLSRLVPNTALFSVCLFLCLFSLIVSKHSCCSDKYQDQRSLMQKRLYFILQVTVHCQGKSRQELETENKGMMLTGWSPLACSASFLIWPRSTYLGIALPTVDRPIC